MHTELSNRSYFTLVEQAEVLKRWILFHGSENQMQLEWKGKTAEVEKMCRFTDGAARHAMFFSAGSRPALRLLLLYRASSRPADSPCADLSRDATILVRCLIRGEHTMAISHSTPFDRAKSGISKEDIHQAHRFDSLVPEFHVRI